jgi:hypothetical protein
MPDFQKTDTAKSPLLTPVIERDYTKGLENLNLEPPEKGTEPIKQPQPGGQQQQKPPTGQQRPSDDFTKGFAFDEEPVDPNDVSEGETLDGVNFPAGSAKTFANFAGDAIKIYLPKLTYSYAKVDIDNVIFNVNQGNLENKWILAFEQINENTNKGLEIPDETIKMWKKAFKDYLEYEKMSFANPKTTFIIATIVLLADQGVRAYQIKKQNERFMEEALKNSNPEKFKRFKTADKNDKENEQDRAA